MNKLLRTLYSLGFYIVTPFILLRLYIKSKTFPAYKDRIKERFLFDTKNLKPFDILLHGVSLGELVAATTLIELFLKNGKTVFVTSMTPTGSNYITQKFGDRIGHQYLPYDLPHIIKKFYKLLQPKLILIMETEIWPNMICIAHKLNIPVFIINARISDKSFPQYLKVKCFFKYILNKLTGIIAQSDLDKERYLRLGASLDKTIVLGNIKFDLAIKDLEIEPIQNCKNIFQNKTILIAASTHHNEEELLLKNLKKLQNNIPNLLLLIAPRHPERFKAIYELSHNLGFETGMRSNDKSMNCNLEVLIIDSIGELLLFYKISNFAFVGGSLVPIGGHNLLEPIAMGVPVFCGPYMNNSKSICDILRTQNAIIQTHDIDDLVSKIIHLAKDKNAIHSQVANATKVLLDNQGSTKKYAKFLLPFLNPYTNK